MYGKTLLIVDVDVDVNVFKLLVFCFMIDDIIYKK